MPSEGTPTSVSGLLSLQVMAGRTLPTAYILDISKRLLDNVSLDLPGNHEVQL